MTIRDLLLDAYAKSKKNQPGKIATETTELLGVGNRIIRTFFQIGCRVNPVYFGASSTVAKVGTGWPRPAAAEAIHEINLPDGTLVAVVPRDQRTAESGMPAVYRWGQVFYAAGNDDDPDTEELTFWYSKVPTDAADLDTAIDALFPTTYRELAVLEIAAYLAVKDKREDEVAALTVERDRWLRMFLAHLEHETLNERRTYGHIQPFNTGSLVPIESLLTGGTEVVIP